MHGRHHHRLGGAASYVDRPAVQSRWIVGVPSFGVHLRRPVFQAARNLVFPHRFSAGPCVCPETLVRRAAIPWPYGLSERLVWTTAVGWTGHSRRTRISPLSL